jgi:hypothetical protein
MVGLLMLLLFGGEQAADFFKSRRRAVRGQCLHHEVWQ